MCNSRPTLTTHCHKVGLKHPEIRCAWPFILFVGSAWPKNSAIDNSYKPTVCLCSYAWLCMTPWHMMEPIIELASWGFPEFANWTNSRDTSAFGGATPMQGYNWANEVAGHQADRSLVQPRAGLTIKECGAWRFTRYTVMLLMCCLSIPIISHTVNVKCWVPSPDCVMKSGCFLVRAVILASSWHFWDFNSLWNWALWNIWLSRCPASR